jgi:tRNA-dihydrouridine synthase B
MNKQAYVTIGTVNIEKSAVLAPMAGVTDSAMRLLCCEYGAGLTYTEMASSKAMVYGDKKTSKLLCVKPQERPVSIQLFGSEPSFMGMAAKLASRYEPDLIDINCGCPVPKVAGNGAGSALMKDLKLYARIVEETVKNASVPVTVKIRKGWNETDKNAVEAARIAQECGAAAIAVHGRTAVQMYAGKADWEIIAEVKNAVRIPVIGNGDVTSVQEYKEMIRQTGCDLVMIGRAACGRPWLFKQILQAERGESVSQDPSWEERLEILRKHISLLVEDKGEYIGMKEARKHVGWYIKGIKNAAKFRNESGLLSTMDDFEVFCANLRKEMQE